MCMHELFCSHHIIKLYNQLFDARIYENMVGKGAVDLYRG